MANDRQDEKDATLSSPHALVVGISGASGSGKTNLSKKLGSYFKNSFVIRCDNYRKPKHTLPEWKYRYIDEETGEQKFIRARIVDEPSAWNVSQVVDAIEAAKNDPEVKIVFVEGFLLYCWPECEKLLDAKLFIEADRETCFERRKKRNHFLDYQYYIKLVWPLYLKHNGPVLEGQRPDIVLLDGKKSSQEVVNQAIDIIQKLQNSTSAPPTASPSHE